MDKIIQEKISADHLLYVSLKYTKTGDVILNLLKRWTSMIEEVISSLLNKAKKDKKLPVIPPAPKMKMASTAARPSVPSMKLYRLIDQAREKIAKTNPPIPRIRDVFPILS